MKRKTRDRILLALGFVWMSNSMPVLAASGTKPGTAALATASTTALVNNRLIVKFKANQLPKGLSVPQINAQLSRPFSAQLMGALQAATGMSIIESHAISTGAHVMIVQDVATPQALAQAVAAIAKVPNVEYVEEDRILTAQAVPNDTYYSNLWGMKPVSPVASPSPGMVGSYGADFETAWNTTTGNGVVVGVVDTGITPHPDIVGPSGTVSPATGNLASSGYDFISDCRIRGTCAATTPSASATVAPSPDASDTGDFLSSSDCTTSGSLFYGCTPSNSSWHGTHVSGTIAALGNNSLGVIGGAYNAKILPVRVLGKGGGYLSDISEGIMWAAGVHPSIANPNPARVISMSLGGAAPCGTTEQNAINAAVAAGAVVVVAAGNSNDDVANYTPASCNNVITVAAIAKDGSRASYSNFSSPATNTTNPKQVTLAAQGADMSETGFDPGIYSTLNAGATIPGAASYAYYQGTSMATPHVSAAVALMLARNPALTPAQVKTILTSSSSLTTFPSLSVWPGWDCATDGNCGAGILNAKLAVQNSIQPLSASASTLDFGAVTNVSGNNKVVTLTNNSQSSVALAAATVTGSNAGFFTVGANTCQGVTIAPSGTCQITMSYAPTSAGTHTATLTVPTTTTGVATTVGLAGSAGAMLTAVNPTLTASTVAVGSSTAVDVTFSNGSPWAVSTGALSLSQPAIMAASADNCSNVTLAASATCTATITITPAVWGAYSGTVSLAPSGGGTPATTTINGDTSGSPPPAASSGSGGGGCSTMPAGANPDTSLLLAMLAVGAYVWRRRVIRARGEA